MAALNEAGVAYEIVPGVSAAFAAAAAVPVSLTDRDRSARVVLTTRHRAGNLSVAEESLEGEAATIASSSAFRPGLDADSTLAIYMPGRDYGALKQDLLREGWPPEARCLLVSSAGAAAQQIADTTVEALDRLTPLPAPVTILVIPCEKDKAKISK